MRLRVALYGLAFHAVVAAAVAAVAAANQAELPAGFFLRTAPVLLLGGFGVYALMVAPYVARRVKPSLLFDSAVGMVAECAVVTLTVLAYALFDALPALWAAEGPGFLESFGQVALLAVLYAYGSFFTHILVVGNAAGIAGNWLLKWLARRAA